jgi:macrocin-O-methyltransferase TylF-like protien
VSEGIRRRTAAAVGPWQRRSPSPTLSTGTAESSIGSIALLRLDSDWYESTVVCLTHLYDLVPLGGVVVIDD